MSILNQITELADRYVEHTGLKLSSISTYAANDGKLLGNLKRNGNCTVRTAEKIILWFAANWPADLEWPRDIPRPKKREAA